MRRKITDIKNVFVFLLLVLFPHLVLAQQQGSQINIGERFSFHSNTLKEDRAYQIYLPQTYDNKFFASKAYPVLYLLDGNTHFHTISGIVRSMSNNTQIPELIIVAISNTNRIRDFTPTHFEKDPNSKDQMTFPSSGGADNFLKFLQTELMPHIEASYRTLPYRILVGHSMGGVLATHTLLSNPSMFQAIIAIDPSLWWDNQILVKRAKSIFSKSKGLNNRMFISLANHPLILDDPKSWEDAVKTFAGLVETSTNASPKLQSKLQYFEAEDHNSVTLVSFYYGLSFIFDGYKPPLTLLLKQPSEIAAHFKNVSEKLGIEILPPEEFINTMGIILLNQMRKIDTAIEVFKLNVSNYPKSFNAYDSLADAYMVKGDTTSAVKNYEKSLELNPENQNAKEQLQKLKKDVAK